MMDMEFDKLRDTPGMELVDVNTTAARKHVGEIGRTIRLLKERARCVYKTLFVAGIRKLHKQIVICMVYFVTMMLNAVPAKLGISNVHSPREIVTQRQLDFTKDCKVQFGSYIEASEDPVITNTLNIRNNK